MWTNYQSPRAARTEVSKMAIRFWRSGDAHKVFWHSGEGAGVVGFGGYPHSRG